MKILAIVAIGVGVFALACCLTGLAVPVWSMTEVESSQTLTVKTITYSGLYQVCTRQEIDASISCDDLGDVANMWTSGLKATMAMIVLGCVLILACILLVFVMCCCLDSLPLIGKIAGGLAIAAAIFMLIGGIVYATEVKDDADFKLSDLHAGWGLCLVGAVACIVCAILACCLD